MCQLITGGAGFIGSCYVLKARAAGVKVITLDKLTYSGNPENLASLENDPDHIFVQGDIGDYDLVASLLAEHKPRAVVNFAAESHVDRSILDPEAFVRTNVLGTTTLLRACRDYLEGENTENFRFLHISTDEVFGSLDADDPPFTERTPYAPNSPYSATKASSDHLTQAWYETYGLPVIITNCSNNYGPRQFPEKLIPLIISNALALKPIPVYGTGKNIRDWLHVEDHCEAVSLVLEKGEIGQSYCIGGRSERTNLDVVRTVCGVLDEMRPLKDGSYVNFITHVGDRPGHDWRYAVDCTKIETELGWKPRWSFEQGIRATVQWYLDNREWTARILNGEYRDWITRNYASR